MNSLSTISRRRYLNILQAGLSVHQYRFARLAALDWLAAFPGDLAAGLLYAEALAGENRIAQAASVLQGLRRADPEFLEAVEALVDLQESGGIPGLVQPAGGLASKPAGADPSAATHLFALTGRGADRRTASTWGGSLWLARQAMLQGKLDLAEEMLMDALRQAPDEPLVQVVHLDWLHRPARSNGKAGRKIAGGQELARRYLQRSPDTLACMLHLAAWLLEDGEQADAVALLHQAAARDVGGQVAKRLWGEHNPYQVLWPEHMRLELRQPLPFEVSAALGWNRLPDPGRSAPSDPGGIHYVQPETCADPSDLAEPIGLPEAPAPVEVPNADSVSGQVSAGLSGLEDTQPTAVRRTPAAKAAALAAGAGELFWALATDDAGFIPAEPQGDALVQNDEAENGQSKNDVADHGEAEGSRSNSGDADSSSADPNPWNPAATPADIARLRLEALVGDDRKADRRSAACKSIDPELISVSKEMDALALRLKLPVHGHLDGRFPVYVVLSLRGRLEACYGAGVAALIESEMDALAQVVGKRRGWTSLCMLADDKAALNPLGLAPVHSGDPWELKLLLADLDGALARRGQCIGALLIVGGPQIVPFHRLPNPVDDQDSDVPSDNPYATRSENYFIPEWPVGRLPGGGAHDARLLLDGLRRIHLVHTAGMKRRTWLERFQGWFHTRFGHKALSFSAEELTVAAHGAGLFHRKPPAFGYSAAVWKAASSQVFRVIGRPTALHVSPPFGMDGPLGSTAAAPGDPPAGAVAESTPKASAARTPGIPRPSGRLGYFNLHGVIDGPEWFGQRDPLEPSEAPDFPVALRPQDILWSGDSGQEGAVGQAGAAGEVPLVVFTQACYGLSVDDCPAAQSMALSFLGAGSLAVVGSTCMSYGAIAAPLAASDLLAASFWKGVQAGLPAGEALRQAKIWLVSEMNNCQGYLDGEEQKTLISFALYGDPLALPLPVERLPKSLRYQDSPLLDVLTVCDRAVSAEAAAPLPPEVLASVRTVVSRYLPGMSDARLLYAQPRVACEGEGHVCPTSQMERRSLPPDGAPDAAPLPPGKPPVRSPKKRTHSKNGAACRQENYSLVTLSKPVKLPNGAHPRIARLTLDGAGKLVKLVVSR